MSKRISSYDMKTVEYKLTENDDGDKLMPVFGERLNHENVYVPNTFRFDKLYENQYIEYVNIIYFFVL